MPACKTGPYVIWYLAQTSSRRNGSRPGQSGAGRMASDRHPITSEREHLSWRRNAKKPYTVTSCMKKNLEALPSKVYSDILGCVWIVTEAPRRKPAPTSTYPTICKISVHGCVQVLGLAASDIRTAFSPIACQACVPKVAKAHVDGPCTASCCWANPFCLPGGNAHHDIRLSISLEQIDHSSPPSHIPLAQQTLL